METTRSIHFIIPIELYGVRIFVSIGESLPIFRKQCKQFGLLIEDTMINEDDDGFCVSNGGHICIKIEKWPTTPENMGVLAHEIFHAVELIMDHIGMKLTSDTSEAFAYLVGYITKKIYTKLS